MVLYDGSFSGLASLAQQQPVGCSCGGAVRSSFLFFAVYYSSAEHGMLSLPTHATVGGPWARALLSTPRP